MKIVREITRKFVGSLPQDRSYFRPSELEDIGFPDFLAERISLELTRNLADSIVPPQTDWASMQTEPVALAWDAFLKAIHAETRLPFSYAESVIESAVADIMEILIEPRKNLPEIIFGNDEHLTLEALKERTQWIVVYRHFGTAIIRFMQRKKLETLSKEKCGQLIAKVDEKLTQHYSPLNWAVLLEPWFAILGSQIESDLLRRFFADKAMMVIAERFDREDGTSDRSRIIEILSKPDFSSEDDLKPARAQRLADLKSDDDEGESLISVASKKVDVEESGEEPILSRYKQDDESTESPRIADLSSDDYDAGEENVPIWQKYIGSETDQEDESSENQDSSHGYEGDEEYDEMEEPLDTEPIIDLTKSPDDHEKNAALHKLLKDVDDRKTYFTDMLFGGDENAFYAAMEDIASFTTWREAARYITTEVFRRNMVDMYSDEAVDFTDRLQIYFLEKEKE